MDKSDWVSNLDEQFKNGRFVSDKEYGKTMDAGYIERITPRRFTRCGRLVAFKVVVTEHTSITGRISRELQNRHEYVVKLRDSDCEVLLDGVLLVTHNQSQRLMLFPADYYNFREWENWYEMACPPVRFNS